VQAAWQALKSRSRSQLIDVRTRAEWAYVGIPDLGSLSKRAVLVEWQTFPDQTIDPRFAERLVGQLKALGVKPDDDLFFICRSGGRSLAAAAMQQWVTMPVTTSPVALKGRLMTRDSGVPSEVGRRPVFPGCKVRRRAAP
jgi:rhodanese-related sulfurtransferase